MDPTLAIPVNLKGIAETLLFPLYFRAVETRRQNALFRDPLAVELISRIDYDFSRLKAYDLLQTAVALRVREFDRCIQDMIRECPQAAVVNLGCGLDTRFQRLDNGSLRWYELDLPEVIDLRRRFFRQTARYRFLASSLIETGWLDELEASVESGLIFVAEGLFPYFEERQLRRVVQNLSRRFPGAVLIFDAVTPLQVELSRFHPLLRMAGAQLKWGLQSARDLEHWEGGTRLLYQVYYFDQPEPRLGWYNILRLFPYIRYGFSVVAVGLGGS